MPETQFISQIMLTAARDPWRGSTPCMGGVVPGNNLLNMFVGNSFGGQVPTSVGVPDLTESIMMGSSDVNPVGATIPLADGEGTRTVGLTSMMVLDGRTPDGDNETYYLGDILVMACTADALANTDWVVPCDGRTLPIAWYDALYNIIGTTYGGDGVQTFGVPDLRGAAPQLSDAGILNGAARGSSPTSALAFTFVMVVDGLYPTHG